MPRTAGSPVSEEVGAELERVAERWRQLPLDQAQSHAAGVRMLIQSLADRVAEVNGAASAAVPDLGPATMIDQLTVMVYDASAVPAVAPTSLVADLASLRHRLA